MKSRSYKGLRRCALLVLGIALVNPALAQKYRVGGTVMNEEGRGIPGAHVLLSDLDRFAVSDAQGQFLLEGVPAGAHVLEITFVGYQEHEQALALSGDITDLRIRLEPASIDLEASSVVGSSSSARLRRSGYSVASLDPDRIAGSSLNTGNLLRTSSGVNIRQTGGYGSSVSISINGLTGKMIRFFEDGIPLEEGYLSPVYLLPSNTIKQINIYKGVVPENLSADALGGAMNFVTLPMDKEYTDVSLEAGSYGLFKAFAGKRMIFDNGLLAGAHLAYARANNRYPVDVEISGEGGRVKDTTLNRFHDAFESVQGRIDLGLVNKAFADELSATFTYIDIDKELQHGLLMQNPAGEARVASRTLRNRLHYSKDGLWGLPLKLELTNVLSLNETRYVDTTRNIYNWKAEVTGERVLGNEIYYFDTPHDATLMQTRNYAKAYAAYKLQEHSELKAAVIYSYYRREGSDPPASDAEGLDPYTAVPVVQKSATSLSYTHHFLDSRLTSISGLKLHVLRASQSFTLEEELPANAIGNYLGAWQVLRYMALPNLLLTASYEYAYRMPDENELFGDGVLISPNTELRPEKSHNINLGVIWDYQPGSNLSANAFFRDISDIIFLGFPINGARYTNVFDTWSYGIDLEGKAGIGELVTLNYGLSYQELRNMSNFNYDGTESTKYYNTRLPNTPWLYGNAGLQLKLEDKVGKDSETRFWIQAFYVQEYFLRPEPDGGGGSKYTIPTQFYQNAGMNHLLKKWNLTIGLEVQNLFNHELYDNFRVQKPGRTFQVLLRYSVK